MRPLSQVNGPANGCNRKPKSVLKSLLAAFVLILLATPAVAQETITRGDDLAVDVALDGRLAIAPRSTFEIVPRSGTIRFFPGNAQLEV